MKQFFSWLLIVSVLITIGVLGQGLTGFITSQSGNAPSVPNLTFSPYNFFSTSGIIECVNSTDTDLDSLNYTLSVTYFDSNFLLVNKILNSSLNTSFFNGTTGFFNVSSLPAQVYNITCEVSDGTSVTSRKTVRNINRAPTTSIIPNISMLENSVYSLNASTYFNSEPAQVPGKVDILAFNASGNFTFTISQNIINLTPPVNFFGLKTFNITAYDLFGANTTSNEITVNVTNVININETFPINGSSITTPASFRASVYDDNPINNCTLRLENTTITTNNPPLGTLIKFGDDDGTDESAHKLGRPGDVGNIFKTVNTNNTAYQIQIRLKVVGNPVNLLVLINNTQTLNLTQEELKVVCGSDTCNFIKNLPTPLEPGSYNITLNSTFVFTEHYLISVDTGTDNNNSSNSVSGDILGEYMISLLHRSRDLEFDDIPLGQGNQTWNISCINSLGQSGSSDNSIVSVQNEPPTTPTFLLPSSGVFDKEINISCGGSTDPNGDRLTYLIKYKKYSEPEKINTIGFADSGNLTFDVSKIPNGAKLKLFCTASDTELFSLENKQTGFPLSISHPSSPTPPTSLTCDEGACSGFMTGDVNLTCSGSTDSDSGFQYFFEASYAGFNGSQWYPVSNITSLIGSVLLNTNRIANGTKVGLRCYANDGTSIRSDFFQTTNITTNHSIVPGMPSVLTPTNGEFQDFISIVVG